MVSADVGSAPDPAQVEAALQPGVKILAITHVDTSTAVVAPVQAYARLARKYNVLTIVDEAAPGEAVQTALARWMDG